MSKKLSDVLSKQPDFVNDTPIDRFFKEVHEFLSKIDKTDTETSIYDDIGLDNAGLVHVLLGYLERLNILVEEKQSESGNILPISLHDMKHFDTMVNLLVVHGINANLPVDIGIPTAQRSLVNFKADDKMFKVPRSYEANVGTLMDVLNAFASIFEEKSTENYLRKLMLKDGPGYLDTLLGYMSLMYSSNDGKYEKAIRSLERVKDTYSLFQIYSLLVSTISQPRYRNWPLSRLSLLVVERDDGLMSLIDFVVGVREDDQIDISKFERVNQIVTAKPKSLTSLEYFDKLFVRIYECMTHVDKPILISCLTGIVTAFYLKNKRIVRDFLFAKVYRVLYNPKVEDFSAKQVNDMINVLISLSRTTYIEILVDLICDYNNGQDFFLNLWIYALFLRKNQIISPTKSDEPYYNIIIGLIRTYMTITDDFRMLSVIVSNLAKYEHDTWQFKIDLETQLAYITTKNSDLTDQIRTSAPSSTQNMTKKFQQLFIDIDQSVDLFLELLKKIANKTVNMDIFSSVLSKWVVLRSGRVETRKSTEGWTEEQAFKESSFEDDLQAMVLLKLLERINDVYQSDILDKPTNVLVMILELLDVVTTEHEEQPHRPNDSDDEDDDDNEEDGLETDQMLANKGALDISLELLTSLLQNTDSKILVNDKAILQNISKKLSKYSDDKKCLSLCQQIAKISVSTCSPILAAEAPLEEDRELLSKALADVNEPLIPIRAHGLFGLRQLIEKRSPVIDIKRVIAIHITQLHDEDPFIFLNVIKGLGVLIDLQPEETFSLLLKLYSASAKSSNIDDVLKIGEVLINYVKRKNIAFRGPFASQLVTTCLENIRNKETVDNRLRMSSMSILGICLQTNPLGIQSHIADIMDCVFGILTFEQTTSEDKHEGMKENSVIMRRSAVHLIYDLMTSSGLSLFPENYSPKKIQTTLSYLQTQEHDYLVCEQISTILEQIQIHQNNSLITPISDALQSQLHM